MTEPIYRWVAVIPARTLRVLAALAERQKRPKLVWVLNHLMHLVAGEIGDNRRPNVVGRPNVTP